MKRYLAVFAAVVVACVMSSLPHGSARAQQPAAAPNPCVMPTTAAATPAQTAWQLFVAINCKAPNGQLVWETWIEQLDLYPASGTATAAATPRKRLHGSPLAQAMKAKAAAAPQLNPATECNPMGAPPSNVVAGATICEEVRLSPTAASYITAAGTGYQVRSGQTAAAVAGKNIQFPTSAVEVKVDWIPASDYNPPFTCPSPPQGVYTETIVATCYALAGIHISSKLLPNWLWATFEPQSM